MYERFYFRSTTFALHCAEARVYKSQQTLASVVSQTFIEMKKKKKKTKPKRLQPAREYIQRAVHRNTFRSGDRTQAHTHIFVDVDISTKNSRASKQPPLSLSRALTGFYFISSHVIAGRLIFVRHPMSWHTRKTRTDIVIIRYYNAQQMHGVVRILEPRSSDVYRGAQTTLYTVVTYSTRPKNPLRTRHRRRTYTTGNAQRVQV